MPGAAPCWSLWANLWTSYLCSFFSSFCMFPITSQAHSTCCHLYHNYCCYPLQAIKIILNFELMVMSKIKNSCEGGGEKQAIIFCFSSGLSLQLHVRVGGPLPYHLQWHEQEPCINHLATSHKTYHICMLVCLFCPLQQEVASPDLYCTNSCCGCSTWINFV